MVGAGSKEVDPLPFMGADGEGITELKKNPYLKMRLAATLHIYTYIYAYIHVYI